MAHSCARTNHTLSVTINSRLAQRLIAAAKAISEDPADLVSDAIELHLDAMDAYDMEGEFAALENEFSLPAGSDAPSVCPPTALAGNTPPCPGNHGVPGGADHV